MEYLTLLFSSFISATLFPMGSEALLVYDINQGLNIYLLLFFATFGNSFGSLLNYYFGIKGEEYLIKKRVLNEQKILKYKNFFDRFGGFALLLSWAPIIGDPITFIAGVLKYDLKRFILLVVLAKFGRYLFLALTTLYFLS